jgi:gamma-glutamyltranspeptidase/glutathione hydrolase
VAAGMIVAPQPVAAEEGLRVLNNGGNAIDAAVTAAFVQGVVDPHMCGIGGGGVMLIYEQATQQCTVVEFYPRAGSLTHEDQWKHLFVREATDGYGYVLVGSVNDFGYQSIAVPGTVAGLDEALKRFGTISWADAIEPAVRHAREGFPVTDHVRWYWAAEDRRRLAATAESARIYTRSGSLCALGDVIVCPDYASTLQRISQHGAREFYEGRLSEVMAADLAANGAFVTLKDLAAYRAKVSEPIRGSYREWDVVSAPLPGGGLTLLQMLNYLEQFDLSAWGWPSVESAAKIAEAMAWAATERAANLGDPEFSQIPVAKMVDKKYPSRRRIHDSPTTTQLNVIDRDGNAVCLTHTLGSGSGVVTPGLGFTYNNYMNCFDPRPNGINSIRAGKARLSMMAPTLIFEAERLVGIIGAPGGTRIVTAILQTLVNIRDFHMDVVQAINSPRMDGQGDVVEVEQRMPRSITDALAVQGHPIHRRVTSYDPYFGEVQAIFVLRDGTLSGGSDPRADGGVALKTA